MVREPKAFLMDEPLSNLDAKLRIHMRAELQRLHDRLKTTTVYVTHDQVEAMTLGDRVAVLRDGILQQVDTPQNLYTHPANLFVAAFMGAPPMNLVEATIDGSTLKFGGFELPAVNGALAGYRQETVIVRASIRAGRERRHQARVRAFWRMVSAALTKLRLGISQQPKRMSQCWITIAVSLAYSSHRIRQGS